MQLHRGKCEHKLLFMACLFPYPCLCRENCLLKHKVNYQNLSKDDRKLSTRNLLQFENMTKSSIVSAKTFILSPTASMQTQFKHVTLEWGEFQGDRQKWKEMERHKERKRRWGNRGYKIPSWLLEKMMRSPENGRSGEEAAFPHKDSSNLPHSVRTLGVEAALSLITRNKPIPLSCELLSVLSSSCYHLPSASCSQASSALHSHQCWSRNDWPKLLSAGSGRMDTK